jgi:hypothetical protein
MRSTSPSPQTAGDIETAGSRDPAGAADYKPEISQLEEADIESTHPAKADLAREAGDVALALFDDVEALDGPIDPKEEKRLVRKIDWLILPYLAVCYCFFYVRPHSYSTNACLTSCLSSPF